MAVDTHRLYLIYYSPASLLRGRISGVIEKLLRAEIICRFYFAIYLRRFRWYRISWPCTITKLID